MTAQHGVLNGQSSSVKEDSTQSILRQDIIDDFVDPDADPEAFEALLADKASATEAEAEAEEPEEDVKAKRAIKVKEGPGVATKLIWLAERDYDLGTSNLNDEFAIRKGGAPVAMMFRGSKSALRSALASAYYEEHGGVASSSALASVLEVLQHRASQSDLRSELPLRVAESGRALWLDLGLTSGQAVRISKEGWHSAASPVIWRRTAQTLPMAMPVKGGSLDELWTLVNVAEQDRPLVIGWLLASLWPKIAHPILLLGGQQGTAKTTTGSILGGLLDPRVAILSKPPKDDESWSKIANGSWVVGVDNVSHIPSWWSDALCRAVTGDGDVARKFYSDDDLTVRLFRRVLILTGIDVGAMRGDLAERLLVVELDAIRPDGRREDTEIARQVEAARPRIVGALLDLAVEVLGVIDGIRPASLPRMADFGRILAAMDAVLGTSAFDAYVGKGDDLAGEVVEGDEVGRAIQAFIWGHPDHRWSGRASDLLDDLEPAGGARPSKYWPDSPRGLSARLKRLTPALESMGILVTQERSNRARRITLRVAGTEEVHSDTAEDETKGKEQSLDCSGDVDELIDLAA